MHIAQRFERLLELYRHPDGRWWSGKEISDATGGVVTRSYVTNLRKGRIENPGFEKLKAIAKVMDFPPERWFGDLDTADEQRISLKESPGSIAQRTENLFQVLRNRSTGESFTNAEVARMSLGDLTEEVVEGIRNGDTPNPTVNQVVALAEVFAIHPSYFLDTARERLLLDEKAMEILKDPTVSAIAYKSLHLPNRERQMLLGIIKQFEEIQNSNSDD